jgi:hypothetical protein
MCSCCNDKQGLNPDQIRRQSIDPKPGEAWAGQKSQRGMGMYEVVGEREKDATNVSS